MTDLIKALRARVALPDIAIKDGHDHILLCQGEEQENARLAPLLSSLIAVVEAADRLMETGDSLYEYVDSTGSPAHGDYMLDALADLRAAVMPKHKENCRIFRMNGVCTCGLESAT